MSDPFDAFIAGLQEDRVHAETAEDSQTSNVLLYATHELVLSGWTISETLPMVIARQVLGVPNPNGSPFAIFQSLENRSRPFELTLAHLESCVREQLQIHAAAAGCQAVIDVRMTFGELTGTPYSQYLFATAHGTPVRLRKIDDD